MSNSLSYPHSSWRKALSHGISLVYSHNSHHALHMIGTSTVLSCFKRRIKVNKKKCASLCNLFLLRRSPERALGPSSFSSTCSAPSEVLCKCLLHVHRNNRVHFLLLKLWLPPASPSSKCFLLKKSHGLLKIKDNSIKSKIHAGASDDRTLKSPLEFPFSWTLTKTTNGQQTPRMHAHFRPFSLEALSTQTD